MSWSPARRLAQAARIRHVRPWLDASGPTTDAGKTSSSRNAYQGAVRPKIRALTHSLRQMQTSLSESLPLQPPITPHSSSTNPSIHHP